MAGGLGFGVWGLGFNFGVLAQTPERIQKVEPPNSAPKLLLGHP